jgi:ubiquinone/menaquinone biosynthesis C-methylase UbiE
MEELFYQLFHHLPRQGPGDAASTRKAYTCLNNIPAQPTILDIGCGSGLHTLALAKISGGRITAVDNCQYFLNVLSGRAREQHVHHQITCINKDMHHLDFDHKSFDLIWSEGAIYIMGFEKGLQNWRLFLKPGGYIAVTEVTWLTTNPPGELANFWMREYPAITTIEENKKKITKCGYTIQNIFSLPKSAWWDDYYGPLEKELLKFKEKYRDNRQAQEMVQSVQLEIEMHRRYAAYYEYVFYIMQK